MCIGHVKSGSWQAPGQAFGNTFVYMVNAEAVAGQRIQPVVVRVDADRNQQIEFWKPTAEPSKCEDAAEGSVTVFLSLLVLLVLTLLLGLLESARVQTARVQCVAALDQGMFSLFSEYDRDLLEQYEVFFLSGGSKGTLYPEALGSKIRQYASAGIGEEQSGSYTGVHVGTVTPEAVVLASDAGGAAFRYQAVLYAREALMEKLADEVFSDQGRDFLQTGQSLLTQADSVSDGIEEIREAAKTAAIEKAEAAAKENPGGAAPEPDLSAMEFENPIHTLKQYMKMGVLGLVAGEEALSSAAAEPGTLMSQRTRAQGFGSLSPEIPKVTGEALLFNEYVLDRLPCLTQGERVPGAFAYQCEYVLAGKNEDRENLKSVLERLLLLRFGMNFTYLLSSGQRQAEAEALAAVICGVLAIPMLTELMKTAIVLLWAYEESLMDVRLLCKGEKVVFVKTDETFQCTVERLFSFSVEDGASQQAGMDYVGYVRLLLALTPLEERTLRCMDMAEQTIRIGKNRPDFCLDTGVFAVRARAEFTLSPLFLPSRWSGGTYGTEETYGYMDF